MQTAVMDGNSEEWRTVLVATPAHNEDGHGVSELSNRLSILFPEPVSGLAGGITVFAYGAVFLVLLLRDVWHPLPDLVAFALYLGILLLGAANICRWLPAAFDSNISLVAVGYLAIMAGWSYLTGGHSTPLTDGEGILYGLVAAAGLAAVLDDVRLRLRTESRLDIKLRPLILPAAAFSLWSLLELGGMPSGWDWFAVAAIPTGLAALFFGYRRLAL